MRTVRIAIHYTVIEPDVKALRQGEFKLKGRTIEQVALEFWKYIKRDSPIDVELDEVFCEGEDITERVKNLKENI